MAWFWKQLGLMHPCEVMLAVAEKESYGLRYELRRSAGLRLHALFTQVIMMLQRLPSWKE